MTESYQIAEKLSGMPESNRVAARIIGRSRTYVSIMRKTWRGAHPTLKHAWKDGDIVYSVVKMIATKPYDQQPAAVKEYVKNTKGKRRSARGVARKVLEGDPQ